MWNTRSRGRRLPRIVGGKIMLPADLKRLHKYMLEVEHIDHISDERRSVVEREWPEMARWRDGGPGPATTRPGLRGAP